MATIVDITVPDLGEFNDVEVIEVLVGPGDEVSVEDGLVTLETDKATMEVPAEQAGTIDSLTVKVGDTVSSGDVIGRLAVADEAPAGDAAADTPAATADKTPEDDQTMVSSMSEPGEQILVVQDLGDFSDVDVIEVHVAPGDTVEIDDPIVTLETDKASLDIPSTAAGKIESVLVKVGDKVSEGDAIVVIDAVASAMPAEPQATAPQAPAAPPPPPAKPAAPSSSQPAQATLPAIDEAGFSQAHASPSVRKLARELGVDLPRVTGTGQKGRILHDDVKAFVKAILTGGMPQAAAPALPQVPKVDFAKFGDVDVQPLTRIQKISGPRLQASWINLPHVTQHDEADITELEEKRQALKGAAKEKDIGLTPLAFIIKACISALKEFPKVNASLSDDGESLVFKEYYHIGFAADTENGLVVPVIHNADRLDVYQLAIELGTLSKAAREGKLKAAHMQGASFTISSLGGIGGTAFTPIVNAPEVAILGVSRSTMQPVWDGNRFNARLMLPLSFSYDHRVIDGAYAVRFTTFLGQALADVDALVDGASLPK